MKKNVVDVSSNTQKKKIQFLMTVVDRSHRIALVGSGGFYSHRCQIIFLLFSAIRVVYQYICKNVKYESYNLVSMRIMEAEYRERDLQQVQHQNKIL